MNEARKLEDIDATYRNGNGSDYTPAIGSTHNSTIAIAIPDDGDNGVYYVSTGAIARQTGPAYPGAHQYQPDKTFAWFQRKARMSCAIPIAATRLTAAPPCTAIPRPPDRSPRPKPMPTRYTKL